MVAERGYNSKSKLPPGRKGSATSMGFTTSPLTYNSLHYSNLVAKFIHQQLVPVGKSSSYVTSNKPLATLCHLTVWQCSAGAWRLLDIHERVATHWFLATWLQSKTFKAKLSRWDDWMLKMQKLLISTLKWINLIARFIQK